MSILTDNNFPFLFLFLFFFFNPGIWKHKNQNLFQYFTLVYLNQGSCSFIFLNYATWRFGSFANRSHPIVTIVNTKAKEMQFTVILNYL